MAQVRKKINIEANQDLKLEYDGSEIYFKNQEEEQLFSDLSSSLTYKHSESRFIDFSIQPLLPRQFSLLGPAISAGDIDGNGEIDLVVGGSLKEITTILYSNNGIFESRFLEEHDSFLEHEDIGTLLFDVDGDDDLDLYIVSGGNEDQANTATYNDRLYVNKNGNFERTYNVIPALVTSGSCVKGCDYDKDGDIDLFIGGRIYPGQYPRPVSSYLLENTTDEKDHPKFINKSIESFKELDDIGMVTDAVWSDIDNDGWMDLIIVGEWMHPRIFKNEEGRFIEITSGSGLDNKVGWWNSIVAGDFDNDGDTDIVCGNIGTNSFYKASEEEPLHIFGKDFDQNGGFDTFLASSRGYENDNLYPIHSWDDMLKQMNFLRKKVQSYESYAKSSVNDLFTKSELEEVLNYQANWFSSTYFENLGEGKFKSHLLPKASQIAPVQSMMTMDVNDDEYLDIVLVGNDYGGDLFVGKYDALNGLILYGDGTGNFNPENYSKNGFLVSGDARSIISFPDSEGRINLVASQNRNHLRRFVFEKDRNVIPLKTLDSWANLTFENGDIRKVELGYGHSSNAQSSRHLIIPPQVVSVDLFSSNNQLSLRKNY